MKAYKNRGRDVTIGARANFVGFVIILLMTVGAARADLVFDSGYNTYDASYGYNSEVGVINDAHLDVLGGEIGVLLSFRENSTGNIYGGQISWLSTADSAIVNIYGGSFDFFAFHSPSTSPSVFLYAYDTIIHPDGGVNNLPWVEGKYYLNDTPFSVTFDGEDSISRLSMVPEPGTFLLLGLGWIIVRSSRKEVR